MPTKKEIYISGKEAAEILTKNSGHEVTQDYVRLLSNQKKIRSRPVDGRTKEYLKADVENRIVRGNKKSRETSTETKEAA